MLWEFFVPAGTQPFTLWQKTHLPWGAEKMCGIVGVARRGQDNWTLPIASDKDKYLKDARILMQGLVPASNELIDLFCTTYATQKHRVLLPSYLPPALCVIIQSHIPSHPIYSIILPTIPSTMCNGRQWWWYGTPLSPPPCPALPCSAPPRHVPQGEVMMLLCN
jgi:hypothetical protein